MGRRDLHRRHLRWLGTAWPPIRAPQTQLNFWLKLAAKRFTKDLQAELQCCDLIPSEWAALRELYRPGRLSPMDIARAIGMTKGGVSKLIVRMVKKGLVKKEKSLYDRRFRTVEITTRGKYVLGFVASTEDFADRKLCRSLQPDERQQLLEWLQRALRANELEHSDVWISIDGRKGQWKAQDSWWRDFLWAISNRAAAFSGSQ